MDIRTAIRNIAGTTPPPIVLGTVLRTDGVTLDLQPLDSDAPPLLGIDLQIGDTAALSFAPEVGALAVVVLDTDQTGFVLGTSKGKIVLNGGENGALIKIEELQNQLSKMTARIDGIIDAIKKATPTPQDGGAGLQATMVASLASLTDKEDFSNINDDNITH